MKKIDSNSTNKNIAFSSMICYVEPCLVSGITSFFDLFIENLSQIETFHL